MESTSFIQKEQSSQAKHELTKVNDSIIQTLDFGSFVILNGTKNVWKGMKTESSKTEESKTEIPEAEAAIDQPTSPSNSSLKKTTTKKPILTNNKSGYYNDNKAVPVFSSPFGSHPFSSPLYSRTRDYRDNKSRYSYNYNPNAVPLFTGPSPHGYHQEAFQYNNWVATESM